nr:putative reverse transcriptase, RNA-dependent DNA polymerase [Tanacetum cinerariifolium]
MALLSMRADRFWKKTGKKITIQGSDVAGFDKSKVECFNCHKMGYFARECTAPRSQDRGKRESYKQDKNKEGIGYSAVPPPPAQIYSPPKKDLSWTGSMSKHKIKFVKEADCLRVIKINNTENARKSTVKYVEMYMNISKGLKVRGNQRNWNNLKSQQLGKDLLMQNKACFKCGYFDHLASNCGVWVDNRETWPKDNYTHKSMTPRAILLKPGTTLIVVSRPNMNVTQPKITSFAKTAHSNVKRSFQRKSAVKNQPRVPRVFTVTEKIPTVDSKFRTAKSTLTADLGDKEKAVKASACWIWRPKQNTSEQGPNCNGVSGNPHNNIDDKGYWDSGCFRHMTGNISYLSEFEPYDGGYVSFGHGGGKDGPGKDVEIHLYRSMIGSLMYLTASRPDIMFDVCACARHQVTPKECHLHAVKRIFRYLKGHPKLGLWYPIESPFDLVAYSDSDYGGATQDRKSTTEGCQFLGRRLILWKCKKQTIVATSTTEAECVAAASGYGQGIGTSRIRVFIEYSWLSEQAERDSEIARIHAEEELELMIKGLNRSNEVIAKHLSEYGQAKADLSVGEKIELKSKMVKYQDHLAEILKYQAQQSKPSSKKEQKRFYMSVLKSHAGWKT